MPQISIIIPIYNVEKYLGRCLDSVLQTDWKGLGYEIIIIDDESPDRSLQIAESYKAKHSEIKLISQKNKGLGGARNTGLKNASGKYVSFLDSDDFLINNSLSEIINEALENHVDILEFEACTVNVDHKIINPKRKQASIDVVTGQEYFADSAPGNSACNKIYRREFLIQKNIFFLEGVYVEDAPFNVEAYMKADRVLYQPIVAVAFYQNPTSITRSQRKGGTLHKFIKDSVTVTQRMSGFLNVNGLSSAARKTLESKIALFVSGILLMIIRSGFSKKEKRAYLQSLKVNKLYPQKKQSGVFIRDIFLAALNLKLVRRLFFGKLILFFIRFFNIY